MDSNQTPTGVHTKEIYLIGSGITLLVDEVDYLFCLGLVLHWKPKDKYIYYRDKDSPRGERKLLHRIIAERAKIDCTQEIDHKNGIKHDCRRENLRAATRSQNHANSKLYKNNTTGYKGVHFNKRLQRYQAYIAGNRLGWFDSAIEAARAYDAAAIRFYGEFARINGV